MWPLTLESRLIFVGWTPARWRLWQNVSSNVVLCETNQDLLVDVFVHCAETQVRRHTATARCRNTTGILPAHRCLAHSSTGISTSTAFYKKRVKRCMQCCCRCRHEFSLIKVKTLLLKMWCIFLFLSYRWNNVVSLTKDVTMLLMISKGEILCKVVWGYGLIATSANMCKPLHTKATIPKEIPTLLPSC